MLDEARCHLIGSESYILAKIIKLTIVIMTMTTTSNVQNWAELKFWLPLCDNHRVLLLREAKIVKIERVLGGSATSNENLLG